MRRDNVFDRSFSDYDVAFIRREVAKDEGMDVNTLMQVFNCTRQEIVNIVRKNWYRNVDEKQSHVGYYVAAIDTCGPRRERNIRVVPWGVKGLPTIVFTGKTFNDINVATDEMLHAERINQCGFYEGRYYHITVKQVTMKEMQ